MHLSTIVLPFRWTHFVPLSPYFSRKFLGHGGFWESGTLIWCAVCHCHQLQEHILKHINRCFEARPPLIIVLQRSLSVAVLQRALSFSAMPWVKINAIISRFLSSFWFLESLDRFRGMTPCLKRYSDFLDIFLLISEQ